MTFCCKTTCSGWETMAHTEIKIAFIQTNVPTLEETKWTSKQYIQCSWNGCCCICRKDRFRNNKEEIINKTGEKQKKKNTVKWIITWRCEFRVSYCNRSACLLNSRFNCCRLHSQYVCCQHFWILFILWATVLRTHNSSNVHSTWSVSASDLIRYPRIAFDYHNLLLWKSPSFSKIIVTFCWTF